MCANACALHLPPISRFSSLYLFGGASYRFCSTVAQGVRGCLLSHTYAWGDASTLSLEDTTSSSSFEKLCFLLKRSRDISAVCLRDYHLQAFRESLRSISILPMLSRCLLGQYPGDLSWVHEWTFVVLVAFVVLGLLSLCVQSFFSGLIFCQLLLDSLLS